MLLAPSILSADFGNLLADVKAVEVAGCEYLHIDVMDGHFVPNISFGAVVLKAVAPHTTMVKDVHLMIENPDAYLEEFAKSGADIITVHQEACRHLHRTIQAIKALGVKAAVSLNPGTPLSTLEEILPELDMVLIMSVNPGFGGQSYIEASTQKISKLRAMIDEKGLATKIQVDGGIKPDNVSVVLEAGADIIVSGSGIYSKDGVEAAVRRFREEAARIGK